MEAVAGQECAGGIWGLEGVGGNMPRLAARNWNSEFRASRIFGRVWKLGGPHWKKMEACSGAALPGS